jgi:flagellar hook-basal body complex protein FliE
MIEALSAIGAALSGLQSLAGGAVSPPTPDAAIEGAGEASGASFSSMLHGALGRLDDTINSANAGAKSFASGNHDIPLSDVMVSLEQANLALQMAANVRDKVVAAYSTVMNMQV